MGRTINSSILNEEDGDKVIKKNQILKPGADTPVVEFTKNKQGRQK